MYFSKYQIFFLFLGLQFGSFLYQSRGLSCANNHDRTYNRHSGIILMVAPTWNEQKQWKKLLRQITMCAQVCGGMTPVVWEKELKYMKIKQPIQTSLISEIVLCHLSMDQGRNTFLLIELLKCTKALYVQILKSHSTSVRVLMVI